MQLASHRRRANSAGLRVVPRLHKYNIHRKVLEKKDGREARPRLGHLSPGKASVLTLDEAGWTAGQSGHEGVKKNLDPSDTRDRTRAVHLVAKRLLSCLYNVKYPLGITIQ